MFGKATETWTWVCFQTKPSLDTLILHIRLQKRVYGAYNKAVRNLIVWTWS